MPPWCASGSSSLIPEPRQTAPTLLNHVIKLDDQIVDALLGQRGLDRRLASFCRLVDPSTTLDSPAVPRALKAAQPAWRRARDERHPLRLYLHGPPGCATLQAAEAIATDLGMRLLHADVSRMLAVGQDLDQLLAVTLREARFQDTVLYLDGVDALRAGAPSAPFTALLRQLADDASLVVLGGSLAWPATSIPTQTLVVPVTMPDFDQRRALWRSALAANGHSLPPADLDLLASRFRLTPAQIGNAAVQLRYREATGEALLAAARAQAGHALDGLAHKLTPVHGWGDLVLPPDQLALLREMGHRVAYDQRVLGDWGFGRKLSLGKESAALFAGPSGTGKTMAAEVIASELGLDLYRDRPVAPSSASTSARRRRTSSASSRAPRTPTSILFFDEADALFGKRSEVRDSHDRYANIEIAYLLQRMEEYDGLAILATNLRENLDEAFVRRLQFIVDFPFPDEAQRLRLWGLHRGAGGAVRR